MMDHEPIKEIIDALAREAEALVVVIAPGKNGMMMRLMSSELGATNKRQVVRAVALMLDIPRNAAEEYAQDLGCTPEQLMIDAFIESQTARKTIDRRLRYEEDA